MNALMLLLPLVMSPGIVPIKVNAMEIYQDFKKTYSAEEKYSVEEFKKYYAQAAKKPTRRMEINNRMKVDVIVSFDEKNAIHFLCVPLFVLRGDDWITVDGPPNLDKKIDDHTWLIGGRQLEVLLVVDPNSMPEAAGKMVEPILKKAFVRLTLMFGRRVGAQRETKKK